MSVDHLPELPLESVQKFLRASGWLTNGQAYDIAEVLQPLMQSYARDAVAMRRVVNLNGVYGKLGAPVSPLYAPIDMLLYCPNCGTQHIDAPETDEQYNERLFESSWWELGGDKPERWTNPPHRSHLCANPACKCVWRPADHATNGVAAIKTEGKADTWPVPHNDEVTAMPALHPVPVLSLALEALQKERQRDGRDFSMLTVRAIEDIERLFKALALQP